MTLDETIERLKVLREELGGDTPFCIRYATTGDDGRVIVFLPAHLQHFRVVESPSEKPYYVSLINGNTSDIVAAWG